jgi:hypothetical protein
MLRPRTTPFQTELDAPILWVAKGSKQPQEIASSPKTR